MMYRIPMPSRTNGVKLHTFGDHSIGVEYTTGEPHVGKLAYDSSCGILAKNITFRRPDIERIVADAVAQVDAAMMPKAGIKRNTDMKDDDNLQYDDAAAEVLSKLVTYLDKYLDPDQMEAVNTILASGDDQTDGDRIGEKREPVGEDHRGRRPGAYGADAARRRPMSAATEQDYIKMFPDAGRLA